MNADPQELEKFSALAHRWWDPESEFKPLHQINPLRLDWIARIAELAGASALDVGCGGGILAESMARRGAKVKGIDLSDKALKVAQLHLHESKLEVDYEAISAEDLAMRSPGAYDLVGKLRSVNLEVVIAVGHADRIGGDAYNMKLSVRRADSVKAYLVSKGIAASRIYTEGKGERQPVKECKGDKKTKELIACLEPNRRVESEAVGSATK